MHPMGGALKHRCFIIMLILFKLFIHNNDYIIFCIIFALSNQNFLVMDLNFKSISISRSLFVVDGDPKDVYFVKFKINSKTSFTFQLTDLQSIMDFIKSNL